MNEKIIVAELKRCFQQCVVIKHASFGISDIFVRMVEQFLMNDFQKHGVMRKNGG